MAKSKPKAKKKSDEPDSRPILYPQYDAQLAIGGEAITVETAKKLLGWEEETDAIKFGSSHVSEISSIYGVKVRLTNNNLNRPIYTGWLATLKQEHLQKRWRFNGDSITIGRTGQIISGQHRLISLILAWKEWLSGPQKDHWREIWNTEPTMESLIVFGIAEDDDTFKTVNCGKSATLADVLYRHELLANLKPNDRRAVARSLDYAIKTVWDRTGLKNDAFAPRRTHGEAIDFLLRHPTILKCVKHIHEENKASEDHDGPLPITQYLPPGTASGILYLMAVSASDYDVWNLGNPPNEKLLDTSRFDRACEYWVALGSCSEDTQTIRDSIAMMVDADTGDGKATTSEKQAVIIKGWHQFAVNDPITAEDVTVKTTLDDYGNRILAEYPVCGGIDLGGEKKERGEDEREPTAEEVEVKKEELRKKNNEEPTKSSGILFELEGHRAANPGRKLLFRSRDSKEFRAYGDDASIIGKILGIASKIHNDGLHRVAFPATELTANLLRIMKAGHKVALIETTDEGTSTEHPYLPGEEEGGKATKKSNPDHNKKESEPEAKEGSAPKPKAKGAKKK